MRRRQGALLDSCPWLTISCEYERKVCFFVDWNAYKDCGLYKNTCLYCLLEVFSRQFKSVYLLYLLIIIQSVIVYFIKTFD